MTSLFAADYLRRTTDALTGCLLFGEDYPACMALATIGFAAVRSTPQTACSHIQDSDASVGSSDRRNTWL